MNISATKMGLPVLCLSVLLAGCSSSPVDESTSSIEDTTVQTATLEMDAENTATMVEEVAEPTNSADTVFYFAFDKAVLSDESRAALVENAQFFMRDMLMSVVLASIIWRLLSVALMRLKTSWFYKASPAI